MQEFAKVSRHLTVESSESDHQNLKLKSELRLEPVQCKDEKISVTRDQLEDLVNLHSYWASRFFS